MSGYVSRSRETLRKKMENDRSRDSVEILKEMASHKADKFRSPKFKYDREEGSIVRETSGRLLERCRGGPEIPGKT